jgi:hypothetical protein
MKRRKKYLNNNCDIQEEDIDTMWKKIKEAALVTIGLKIKTVPDTKWKKSILIAEHSPIRLLKINWIWNKIMSFVSVHFTRHKIGIEHYVKSQREDITKEDTYNNTRREIVSHMCEANAQAIINISRKRLCKKAHIETTKKWIEFLDRIKDKYPELYYVCVPECIYRGGCPEMKSCKRYEVLFDNITYKDFRNIDKRYEYYHKNK